MKVKYIIVIYEDEEGKLFSSIKYKEQDITLHPVKHYPKVSSLLMSILNLMRSISE